MRRHSEGKAEVGMFFKDTYLREDTTPPLGPGNLDGCWKASLRGQATWIRRQLSHLLSDFDYRGHGDGTDPDP